MKMQIWKIYVSEGTIAAVHGFSHPIYEAYIPDLKLSVNHVHHFVNEDSSRYEEHIEEDQITATPQPELICEFEMNRIQVDDARACLTRPEDRIREIVMEQLKKRNIKSDYKDENSDDER